MKRIGMTRVNRENFQISLFCLMQPAGLMVFEGNCQQLRVPCHILQIIAVRSPAAMPFRVSRRPAIRQSKTLSNGVYERRQLHFFPQHGYRASSLAFGSKIVDIAIYV
jgi:hypothetical protein